MEKTLKGWGLTVKELIMDKLKLLVHKNNNKKKTINQNFVNIHPSQRSMRNTVILRILLSTWSLGN